MDFDLTFAFGLVITAMLISLSSLFALSAFNQRNAVPKLSIFNEKTPGTVFLFDGDALVDATPSARELVTDDQGAGGPWFRALAHLEPMFPGLSRRLEGLPREGRFVLCSREDLAQPLVLRAESVGGLTRLTLLDSDTEERLAHRDGASDVARHEELTAIREVVAHSPALIWRVRPDGQVIWANGAYLLKAAETLEVGQDLSWPLPQIFDLTEFQAGQTQRRSVRVGQAVNWYEVSATTKDEETVYYALPADRLIQAEVTLRDFMQTLTKTFAQLPIGLAIFDRNRVLQLFNPALLDLTGLQPEVLIARPTLPAFLDAMRERSMIPEPKDYRSWRKQMVALEEAAASGHFEETWSLPSGQTYRITGRPHPNGALAFLFEDISNEMMRTRRYRADLELGQAVIDAMDSVVAVFSHDGNLVMTNKAYAALWGKPEASPIADIGRPIAIEGWRELSAPSLLWNDLSEYIGTLGEREAWDGEFRLLDGRAVACRVSPMPHGSTLVAFAVQKRLDRLGDDEPAVQAVLIA
ncbi:MAG: PAS-domain containing protein [Paracoccaceae bacterium]